MRNNVVALKNRVVQLKYQRVSAYSISGERYYTSFDAWKMICEETGLGNCPVELWEALEYQQREVDGSWFLSTAPDIDVVLELPSDEPTPPPTITEATPELARWLTWREKFGAQLKTFKIFWLREGLPPVAESLRPLKERNWRFVYWPWEGDGDEIETSESAPPSMGQFGDMLFYARDIEALINDYLIE